MLNEAGFVRFAVLAFIVAVGVRAHATTDLLDPLPKDELAARAAELQEVPMSSAPQLLDDGDFGDCAKKKLVLPFDERNGVKSDPLELTLIQPESDKPVPVIILMPTIKGWTQIESKIASNFCGMGFATIIANVNDPVFPKTLPSWGYEDRTNRHAILAVRTAIDYASTNAALFDPTKIGLMGSSLGGIQSAFLAGLEAQRLAGIFLVVGGSNLPGIMSTSDQPDVVEFRNARMTSAKISTIEEYEAKLRETVRYDSSYFLSNAITDHVFMTMSNNDSKVPTPYQNELFEQLGKPASTTFSVGHVETIIGLTYFYFSYVSDFFNQRFGIQPETRARIHSFVTKPIPNVRELHLPADL